MNTIATIFLAVILLVASMISSGCSSVTESKENPEQKAFTVIATAYSDDPISINVAKWHDGKTATMTNVRWGVVAVDPKVIPLGSKIFIKDMGWFSAEDKGGKIKGNRIDIFYPTRRQALNFGIKELQVLIVDNEANNPKS